MAVDRNVLNAIRTRVAQPLSSQTVSNRTTIEEAEIPIGTSPLTWLYQTIDPLPGDRSQRWILLHDGLGLMDEWQTLGDIEFAIDPRIDCR